VGFTEFKNLPTIELLSIDKQGSVSFFAFNAKTEDTEIAPFNRYEMAFDKASILDSLDAVVNKAKEELRVAESKRKAFLESFAKVFEREMVGATET
jgi:hypothetical protein